MLKKTTVVLAAFDHHIIQRLYCCIVLYRCPPCIGNAGRLLQ